STNWMNLFIGVKGCPHTSWNGYHYVVNRTCDAKGAAFVECLGGNGVVGTAEISVQDCKMTYKVPRALIGVDAEHFELVFKIADGVEHETDILDYYVSGEVFPIGRLGYIYKQ
ncbi:MAG: hypothetical protein IKU26_02530, partial [Clostridia bacterium]|nr:hypothetical protein [Clostridia bacterium]